MLVVKVEVWPGGDAENAREVGRVAAANISNLANLSSYLYTAQDDRNMRARSGKIEQHQRSAGFYKLVAEIFTQLAESSNETPDYSLLEDISFEDSETLRIMLEKMFFASAPRPLGTTTKPPLR